MNEKQKLLKPCTGDVCKIKMNISCFTELEELLDKIHELKAKYPHTRFCVEVDAT